MKHLWAVACPAIALALIGTTLAGCAATPKKLPSDSVPSEGEWAPPADNVISTTAAPEYKIGTEDVLHVSVWESKELTLSVVVRPDGKISLPLLQDVQAEGLSASELAQAIQFKLLTYVKEPQVSVVVLQVNAPKIYVIGNVAKPGPYSLRSEMSVLQALSVAGGFTQFASPRSIKLVRGSGANQEVRKLNYFRMIDDGGEGNLLLRPGDTVVVP